MKKGRRAATRLCLRGSDRTKFFLFVLTLLYLLYFLFYFLYFFFSHPPLLHLRLPFFLVFFFPHLLFDLPYLCFDPFAPPGRKWLELISIWKLGLVISYCTFNLLSIKGSSC